MADPPEIAMAHVRVFLSYARTDKAIADGLRAELEAAGLEVFRDLEDTVVGEAWWTRLQELISRADAIVFLMSSRSSSSAACMDEIAYAVSLHKRILPAVLEAVDWAHVPQGLAKIHSVYLTGGNESKAVVQLVAAAKTDIGWVREHTRLLERAQRWVGKERDAAELLAGPAIDEAEKWLQQRPAGAEGPTNLHQEYILASRVAERAERQRQLEESEKQRRILQEQKDRAEASFRAGLDVITETQERILDGLGQTKGVTLATREAVTEALLDSTRRLHAASPDFYPSSVQMQLAGNELRATQELAGILVDEGNFDRAEEMVKRAKALAEVYYQDEYNPLQRRAGLRQLGQLMDALGNLRSQQGRHDEAIAELKEGVALRERALAFYSKTSNATDFRLALANALQRLSVAYLMKQEPASAIEPSQRALALTQGLIDEEDAETRLGAAGRPLQPLDKQMLRFNLATMLNTVGDALFDSGQTAAAEPNFHQAYEVYTERSAAAPDDLSLLRSRSIGMERLGNVKRSAHDFEGAQKWYGQALALKQLLVDADPKNARFRQDYQIIRSKLEELKAIQAAR
jgi:hypothetical protein